jgi:hypothetical protein
MLGDANKQAYVNAFEFTVIDMYMASSVNECNTTPPRNSSVLNVVILECNSSYML